MADAVHLRMTKEGKKKKKGQNELVLCVCVACVNAYGNVPPSTRRRNVNEIHKTKAAHSVEAQPIAT